MLPENSVYGPWPASGEIDIMEHVNYETSFKGSLHYGSSLAVGQHSMTGGRLSGFINQIVDLTANYSHSCCNTTNMKH